MPLTVRGFKEDRELNQTVLRYLTFEKFVSLLELEAVWFSRLGALEDRFEGTLPSPARERMLQQDREHKEWFQDSHRRAQFDTMTDRNISDGRACLAVNCWFLGERDSPQMWQAYAPDGRGVAIRSTIRRLSIAFCVGGDYAKLSQVGRVHYVKFDELDIPLHLANDAMYRAFIKHERFAFEQEVRIATMNSVHPNCLNADGTPFSKEQAAGRGQFDPERKGFYLRCRLPELFQAVLVSPSAPSHFGSLISRILTRYNLGVSLV